MLKIHNFKKIITTYSYRILLFIFFFHGIIKPIQIIMADKIVKPLIEKKIVKDNNYELIIRKYRISIVHKFNKKKYLTFSIPFGQFYFFILFFFGFKPKTLISGMSFYNLSLVPLYTFAIFLFLNGNFIFGYIITLNEKFYRLMYGSIFFLRIINRKQFNLIFTST